ncbi:hypothetical protein SVIOM74S_07575 [Streptomyces violarus]
MRRCRAPVVTISWGGLPGIHQASGYSSSRTRRGPRAAGSPAGRSGARSRRWARAWARRRRASTSSRASIAVVQAAPQASSRVRAAAPGGAVDRSYAAVTAGGAGAKKAGRGRCRRRRRRPGRVPSRSTAGRWRPGSPWPSCAPSSPTPRPANAGSAPCPRSGSVLAEQSGHRTLAATARRQGLLPDRARTQRRRTHGHDGDGWTIGQRGRAAGGGPGGAPGPAGRPEAGWPEESRWGTGGWLTGPGRRERTVPIVPRAGEGSGRRITPVGGGGPGGDVSAADGGLAGEAPAAGWIRTARPRASVGTSPAVGGATPSPPSCGSGRPRTPGSTPGRWRSSGGINRCAAPPPAGRGRAPAQGGAQPSGVRSARRAAPHRARPRPGSWPGRPSPRGPPSPSASSS